MTTPHYSFKAARPAFESSWCTGPEPIRFARTYPASTRRETSRDKTAVGSTKFLWKDAVRMIRPLITGFHKAIFVLGPDCIFEYHARFPDHGP